MLYIHLNLKYLIFLNRKIQTNRYNFFLIKIFSMMHFLYAFKRFLKNIFLIYMLGFISSIFLLLFYSIIYLLLKKILISFKLIYIHKIALNHT